MSFLATLKSRIGQDAYLRLEKEAENEVASAIRMALQDDNHQDMYYQQRDFLGEFLSDFELFEKKGLKIAPTEVVGLLFRCKLMFAVATEREYRQRCGNGSPFDSPAMALHWSSRADGITTLVEQSFDRLERDVRERTLITPLNSFRMDVPGRTGGIQNFFDEVLKTLGMPFEAFIDADSLIQKHKHFEPHASKHDSDTASAFFQTPSIGCRVVGSHGYCFWKSVFLLRAFLQLLRIGAFIYPGQRDFGLEVKVSAPVYPVFLGQHSTGCFMWHEDKKESWAKYPDGSLFLSFGFRGLSEMWLDRRTFGNLSHFLMRHRNILESIKSTWTDKSISDVAPSLDLLSSAVQMPDLGAKILLIYTCLEHLFVPKNTQSNQKTYIIGGLKALRPTLLQWFDKLYKLRCDYAHRGFVIRDDQTMDLAANSVGNVLDLLQAKLSVA